jgi:flagellar hook-associated protein 3 FlgL
VVTSNDPALGAMNATPGTEVANAYAYVGNSSVNSVQVGDSLSVATNLPGDQLFTSGANVIGSLNGLITALQSGTSAQIQTATTAVSTSLNSVTQQRVPLDNSISQLNSQESFLSQETLTLSTQQTALVGVNLATSATNLAQAETANSAVLAAAAKVLPQTLLNYLSPGIILRESRRSRQCTRPCNRSGPGVSIFQRGWISHNPPRAFFFAS